MASNIGYAGDRRRKTVGGLRGFPWEMFRLDQGNIYSIFGYKTTKCILVAAEQEMIAYITCKFDVEYNAIYAGYSFAHCNKVYTISNARISMLINLLNGIEINPFPYLSELAYRTGAPLSIITFPTYDAAILFITAVFPPKYIDEFHADRCAYLSDEYRRAARSTYRRPIAP